jgi:uncharacterized protein (TIGR02594 family)
LNFVELSGKLESREGRMEPSWLRFAFDELLAGVAELPGPPTQPRIALYEKTVGMAPDDELPWCAAFVHWCLAQAGLAGTGKPSARSFTSWGNPTPPRFGAVAVYWRVDPKGWQGHVGFVVGSSPGTLIVLGGNQGNAVSIELFSNAKLLGCRWPLGAEPETADA